MADMSVEEARIAGQWFKERHGLTDEEFEKNISYGFNRRLIANGSELLQYKIVAECVEAVHCGAGCKVGQKFVFKALPTLLLPEESDCALCAKALGPVAELLDGLWDRILDGLDPNEGIGLYAHCLDHGIEYGGLGHVVFRVRAEKADKTS